MQAVATQPNAGRKKRGGGSNTNLLRAIRSLGEHRKLLFITYGALVIATMAQLAVPQLIQNMINSITGATVANTILGLPEFAQGFAAGQAGYTVEELQNYQTNGASLLITSAVIIVVFAAIRGLFSFVQTFNSEKLSQSTAFSFRNSLFAKLQRLSFSYYDQNQTGQLMIRATDDIEKVRLFIAQGLLLAVQAILLLVATLVILFATNWQLTLVVLPILPIALLIFMVFAAKAQPLFMGVQQRLSRLNTVLQENLAGIKVVKAYHRESYEQKRFDDSAESLLEQQLKVAKTFSFLFPIIFLIMQFGQAAILYFGGREIINGTLSLGDYQAFSLYVIYVFFPLGQLGMIISMMAQASASANRVYEILDARNDIESKPGALPMPPIQGRVEFDHVTFRYFNSGAPALEDVNFSIEPGMTVALLGGTGSGKTSIINLIPRFYDATEGSIRIDGHDVRDVTLDSLRTQIGIVLQETNLFSGSIRDNIAFGRPDASDEEVIAAATMAAAHDFITGFPDGYDTKVGERGTTLSGGQKQRIAIARALLLDPRVLILDDSTSSVDLLTEATIQAALDKLMHGRTSFVIAQRITTVLNADLILVLDKGKLVASGKHADLLENEPLYAEIYYSQLVEDAAQLATSAEPVTEAQNPS